MNGAESLIRTAIAAGVEVCFANPGTTEMPLVAALDSAEGLRAILGLFEGVCTGAADGYGRMAEKPAMTLLHLGPGFAHGIANLHNARRARSPIVNLIGDHATWHVGADAPLTSDIVSLATPVSGWVRSVRTAASLANTTAQAIEMLKAFDTIVLAGAKRPVAFFGYPDFPSQLIPEGLNTAILAEPTEDVPAALEALASEIGAPASAVTQSKVARPERPVGKLNAMTAGAAIALTMPEGSIVMDEAATTGLPFLAASAAAPPHTYLSLTGGAIGQGLPCATGAAVACPDRRVIAFQADGSGMYTLQALWTQARESLNVTTVLCNNHSYRILQVELARAGVTEPGRKARSLTSLANPDIEWTSLARGLGVPAVRVETAEDLTRELERSLATPGPSLIEMIL